VKPVAINARRWFDGQNTYHSVRVIFNDGTERVAPFAYGYGEQFLHTAGELCGMADPYDCTTRWCREAKVTIDVVDVTRRGDLHENGRTPRKRRTRYPARNIDAATTSDLVLMAAKDSAFHRTQRAYAALILKARDARLAGRVHEATQYEQAADRVYNVEMPNCYRW
jgi:hypothetical protein